MTDSVLHCGDDVLDQECDLPTVHHHLTNLPQTIDFASNLQKIMDSASLLFRKHPPSYLAGKNKSYERCSILSGTVSRIEHWRCSNRILEIILLKRIIRIP